MKLLALLALLASFVAAPALAAPPAPQPTKPVGMSFFSGRWYEIARTANMRQRDCEAPTYDFKPITGGVAPFVLTCRKGSPEGRAESLNVTLKLPTDPARNKFRVSALGGVLATDYWIIDRADDLSWAIMATPGGKYVWILARKPTMDAGTKAEVLRRVRGMGYDPGKIVQPRHG